MILRDTFSYLVINEAFVRSICYLTRIIPVRLARKAQKQKMINWCLGNDTFRRIAEHLHFYYSTYWMPGPDTNPHTSFTLIKKCLFSNSYVIHQILNGEYNPRVQFYMKWKCTPLLSTMHQCFHFFILLLNTSEMIVLADWHHQSLDLFKPLSFKHPTLLIYSLLFLTYIFFKTSTSNHTSKSTPVSCWL